MPIKKHLTHFASLLSILILLNGCSSLNTAPNNIATTTSSKLSEGRYGHTAVLVGDSIYTIGGSNKNGQLNTIEIIDINTLVSVVKHIDITPRLYASAVWDGDESIYVFGGLTRKNIFFRRAKNVDVINTRTLEVSRAPDILISCDRANAARIKDEIFISGGMCETDNGKGEGYSSHVQRYSIKNRVWSLVTPLSEKIETKTIATKGKLYAVGGYNGKTAITDFRQYSPTKDTWDHLPPLPIKTSAHSLVAVKNKIYVLGDYEDMDRSFAYDIKKKEWSQLNLQFKPVRHASAVYNNKNIVLVGGNTGGNGPFHNYIQVIKTED